MKVILIVFSLFLGFMFYSMIRVSGNISRLEEERDRLMEVNKSEYLCNPHCPFHHRANGKDYCKFSDKECDYKGEE